MRLTVVAAAGLLALVALAGPTAGSWNAQPGKVYREVCTLDLDPCWQDRTCDSEATWSPGESPPRCICTVFKSAPGQVRMCDPPYTGEVLCWTQPWGVFVDGTLTSRRPNESMPCHYLIVFG